MIFKMFAVKDMALNTFSAPFAQQTMEAGQRMWRDLVMFGSEDNRYKRHPEDYCLYLVGEYDDDTAELMKIDRPMRIQSAAEMLKPTEVKEDE